VRQLQRAAVGRGTFAPRPTGRIVN